ncbi:MAG: ATP-binding protein [Chloroflexota bacterium]|nr:ATP-binding protein [Chloroflexota bacterium]
MRIRHKILLGYVALISMAVVLVVFFLYTLSDINHQYASLLSRDQKVLLEINDLRAGVQSQVVAARSYEQIHDQSFQVQYNEAVRQQEQAFTDTMPLLTSEEDKRSISTIRQQSNTYSRIAGETIGLSDIPSPSNITLVRLQGETARLTLINTIDSFIVRKNRQLIDAQTSLTAKVDDVSTQLLVLSLLGVIGSLTAATLLTEGFTSPLRRLMRNIQGISSGDLRTAVAVRSRDEIGELATVLETMRQRLAATADENQDLLNNAREEAEKLAHTQAELESANVDLQEALQTESEARKRMEEIDRLKSEFASMISHELKTPVSYVYNYAGALKEHNNNLNEGQRSEFLTAIQGEAQHLLTLIDDIMAISLLESVGLTHRFVETDLRKLTDSVVKDQQLTTRRHAVTIKGPDSLYVRADPTRLKQVLNNLVSNAIKYSPQGGPVEVRLYANNASGQALIYVRDHGIGIDPRDVPKLFDRFSRIQRKETMAIPGSGLGLYIAHHIVEAHGGTLKLEPAPGKGTIAEVTVPLIVKAVPALQDEQPTGHINIDTGAEAGRSLDGHEEHQGHGNGVVPTDLDASGPLPPTLADIVEESESQTRKLEEGILV